MNLAPNFSFILFKLFCIVLQLSCFLSLGLLNVHPPPGVADSASSCQAGLLPLAVRSTAHARAAVDESEGRLG